MIFEKTDITAEEIAIESFKIDKCAIVIENEQP